MNDANADENTQIVAVIRSKVRYGYSRRRTDAAARAVG